jgi:YVTN family beta-propeller protein
MSSRSSIAPLLALALAALIAVACTGGAADPNTLVVVTHGPSGEVRFLQMGSGTVTGRVHMGGEPHHLVRDTGRGRVYVTDRAGDSVAVVDILNQALVQSVRVGREPHFAAIAPDGSRLYVTVAGEGVLTIVNLETLALAGRIPVGNRPMGVAVSSDGSRVFVANDADETIAVVDPGLGRRAARPMAVPGGVHGGLALSNDGTTLLSGTLGRPSITALTVGTREAREVALGSAASEAHGPHNVLATPDGRFWVAALAGTSDVVALPAGGGEPVAIEVGQHPSGFAVAPGGRLLVVARDGENLTEVDLEKGKVTRRMRIGPGHNDVTVFSKSALDGLREKAGG